MFMSTPACGVLQPIHPSTPTRNCVSHISLSSPIQKFITHLSYHHSNRIRTTTTAATADPRTVQIPPLLDAEALFPTAVPPLLGAEAEGDGVGVKVVCWDATPVRESGREGLSEERVMMVVLLLLVLLGGVVELRLDWARPIWLWVTI